MVYAKKGRGMYDDLKISKIYSPLNKSNRNILGRKAFDEVK